MRLRLDSRTLRSMMEVTFLPRAGDKSKKNLKLEEVP